MIHYFFNLYKDLNTSYENKLKVAEGVKNTIKEALTPFYQFLDTSIRALERKENIKAKWKQVKSDDLIELKINGSLYETPKYTKIKVYNLGQDKGTYRISGMNEKDFDEPLIILPFEYQKIDSANWAGEAIALTPAWVVVQKNDVILQGNKKFKVKSIQNDVLEIEDILDNTSISFEGKTLDFEIIEKTELPPNCKIIHQDESRYIVYSKDNSQKHNPKLLTFLNKQNAKLEDGSKFDAEHEENMTFRVQDTSKFVNKKVYIDGVEFKISGLAGNHKDKFWIQLEELEETDDDIPGYSPLKYFFDDDVTIVDNNKNEYVLFQGIESEYKLILKHKGQFCLPKGDILEVKVNTYQLRKQLEAVLTLQNMPVPEQANLIKLFEKREKIHWEKPQSLQNLDWIVLTNDDRSGVKEQRDFVEKALSTPDFAILEGPPGSGKTTVILELICQLAKQGKRVLLCGSTHVAIDNVLERLHQKRDDGKTLIQKFNILPVRIGDENRISEDVREFQINNLIEKHQISEDLLLEAANLVCGTTIGILQHPHLKKRKVDYKNLNSFKEPIIPEFDYLIIDECSKTTFQEFLVPALYAKKWILVGDVMQLAPFTDREQIVANIENLELKERKSIDKELQIAIFYLLKLSEIARNKFVFHKTSKASSLKLSEIARNKFVMPLNTKVLHHLLKELEGRNVMDPDTSIIIYDESKSKLELSAYPIILIEEDKIKENLDKLPETHAILRLENWQETEHAFQHNHWQNTGNNFKLKVKGKELNNSFEITEDTNKHFKEKSWAEEITWRLEREHQLRLLGESKTKKYTEEIKDLIPVSMDKKDIENRINTIATIAFPSILESLIKGIPSRLRQKRTTISEGFKSEELRYRRNILTYQHRMHPDISKFPREQYYKKEGALLDLEKPTPIEKLRQWNYLRYEKRSIWIDIKGKTIRNYNLDEADKMIGELEKFLQYAFQNNQPEGKEWTVACLTFYKGQETRIRERLQKLTGNEYGHSNFNMEKNQRKVNIKLHTVDKFQGQEADIVFLSMVQTFRDGFLDNPNRLNVAITRAKFQLVILGNYEYFSQKSKSDDLKNLAQNTTIQKL